MRMNMTEKQKKCIDWICKTLGYHYYGKDTVLDASKFIGKHIQHAKDVSFNQRFYSMQGLDIMLCTPPGYVPGRREDECYENQIE